MELKDEEYGVNVYALHAQAKVQVFPRHSPG